MNGTTILNVLAGYKLVPLVGDPHQSVAISLHYLLFETDEEHIQYFKWSNPYPLTVDPFTDQTVYSTITDSKATNNRSHLHAAVKNTFTVLNNIDVADLANPSQVYLTIPPILRLLGEQKEVSV